MMPRTAIRNYLKGNSSIIREKRRILAFVQKLSMAAPQKDEGRPACIPNLKWMYNLEGMLAVHAYRDTKASKTTGSLVATLN